MSWSLESWARRLAMWAAWPESKRFLAASSSARRWLGPWEVGGMGGEIV